jgi:DNA-binding CsgD family transcriptional regulator
MSVSMDLVGRRREVQALDALLDSVRRGRGARLVLQGAIGVGKSRLLNHLADRASGFGVVATAGVEAESELAFAGLQQLCAPLLTRLPVLPAPQADAVRIAFGLAPGEAPSRFLVGLAVLGLLAAEAEQRPLLCLVDDAQWLDRASLQALAFVARRLVAEAVAVVFVVRESARQPELEGLPVLVVEELAANDARLLLERAVPGRMDQGVRDRIVAESRGNPLALLELPRGLDQRELAGGFRVPPPGPLVDRIEQSYRRRLDDLPAPTRLLLLAASAEPVGDAPLLWRTSARLGIDAAAAAPASAAGLIDIDTRVRFAHPLLRSVVYRAGSAQERRHVHAALAAEIDPAVDPDREAWHRAQATITPDEDVAAVLERSAGRAQSRGGFAAAAAFLERATELTPDPAQRARRALRAAEAKYQSGAPEDALVLLDAADAGSLEALDQARTALLRGQVAFALTRGRDAPALLLTAAQRFDVLDRRLARETYLEAVSAALFAGRLAAGDGARGVAAKARAAAGARSAAPAVELLLDGVVDRLIDGYAAAAPTLQKALLAFRNAELRPDEELRWLWMACWCASDLWDDEAWHQLSTRHVQLCRDTGALSTMPIALTTRILVHLGAGELTTAAYLVQEVDAVRQITGDRIAPYSGLLLAALQGDNARAQHLVATTTKDVESRGEGFGLSVVDYAVALLGNSACRYGDALLAARRASEHPGDLGTSTWALAELTEAGVRAEAPEIAGLAVERLTETTQASGTDWALGVEARCRALLGNDPERLFQEAAYRLGRTRMRVDLARTHLLYGEWLRRADRWKDARDHLGTAYRLFSTMGTASFAARAARELRAVGGSAPDPAVHASGGLTSQEWQVASMARDGYTNPEIGARLFISARTVEWHLSKVFAKLNITNRRSLRDALPKEGTLVRR